jgi:hypothetical protein
LSQSISTGEGAARSEDSIRASVRRKLLLYLEDMVKSGMGTATNSDHERRIASLVRAIAGLKDRTTTPLQKMMVLEELTGFSEARAPEERAALVSLIGDYVDQVRKDAEMGSR